MIDKLQKLPVWAYTLVLMAACCLSALFTANLYRGLLAAYGLTNAGSVVLYVLLMGVISGGIMRLLVRVVYSVGDRIFFGLTRSVPDYNLRRLPVAYNNFVKIALFWLIVAELAEALFMSLLMYVYPVGYYLWRFLSSVVLLVCIGAAYFTINKAYVPTWQSGKCFIGLAIPTVVLFALSMVL